MSGDSRITGADLAAVLPDRPGDRPLPPVLTAEEWAELDLANLQSAQDEVRRDQIRHRLATVLAGRPPRMAGDWPLDPSAARWAADLADHGHAGVLYLSGGTGSGKTTMAWKVVETALEGGYRGDVEWVKAKDLLRASLPPVDWDLLDRWAQVSLLVVDDLGKGGTSEWQQAQLHGLFDERSEAVLPLIITAEVKIRPLLDPATWSRLDEHLTPVHLGSTDHRRPA